MTDHPTHVHSTLRRVYPDGRVIDTQFAPTGPSPAADPNVRNRIAPLGEAVPSQLITEFAPAPSRPVSYPAGLPFIPDRAVWTTESPSGANLEGARWPCSDPDVLLEAVVSASVADGWRVVSGPPGNQRVGEPGIVLKHESMFRELQVFSLDDRSLLQLWDVPDSFFGTPTA